MAYLNPRTGAQHPLDIPLWRGDDGGPLLLTPGLGLSRDEITREERSLWRYRAGLAGDIASPISLGEGLTPLLARAWGDHRPLFKMEGQNPSGAYKDRGAAVMLSYLRERGIPAVLEDSSGNGGAAVAAYGAAGGIAVKVLAPATTTGAKIQQARAYGAEIELVPGPREASAAEAIRQSQHIFYASHNWQAFFIEGVKTLAYELWEDLGFQAPDNIIFPVGGGSILLGLHFGFEELRRAGQIAKAPRLFAAQPLNCSPLEAAFSGQTRAVSPTIAEGASIAHPLRLQEMLAALKVTGGAALAISEEEIIAALRRLCAMGLYVEPTSALAAAALTRLGETIAARETTVVILTATGLKASARVEACIV